MRLYQATYLQVDVHVDAFGGDETGIDVAKTHKNYVSHFLYRLQLYLVHRYGYPEFDGHERLIVKVSYVDEPIARAAWQIVGTDADEMEYAAFEEAIAAVDRDVKDADEMDDIVAPDWDFLERRDLLRLETQARKMETQAQEVIGNSLVDGGFSNSLDFIMTQMVEVQSILMSLDRLRAAREQYDHGPRIKHWMIHPLVEREDEPSE